MILLMLIYQNVHICNKNLVLQLITAYLPLLKTAASPLEWGILTLDLNRTFDTILTNGTGILRFTLKKKQKVIGLGKWTILGNDSKNWCWHVNETQQPGLIKQTEPCDRFSWGMQVPFSMEDSRTKKMVLYATYSLVY